MKELKINPVFRDLIQPLTAEEFKQLEDNVLKDGIRDAIVVWNDTIIDGHNRYQLAQEHGLEFSVHEVNFESEDHAVLWIIDNQMGRRNLADFVKLELQQKRADVLYEQGRQVMSEASQEQTNRGNQYKKVEGLSTMDKPSKTEPAHNTRDIIAESLNWGTGKVARGQYVIKHAPEEVKQQLRAGDLSMNEAYNAVKKQEKEINKNRRAEEIKNTIYTPVENVFKGSCIDHIQTLLDESIDIVFTDPPYGVDFQLNAYNNNFSRKIKNDSDCNTAMQLLNNMLSLIKPKIKADGQLYIFCSWQMYPIFANIITEHFEIHNLIVWNKMIMGMGDLSSNYGGMYELIIFAGNKREFTTRPKNIIECKFNDERFHNAQKPVSLIKSILEITTRSGDFIYDPFLGSGSTAVAAKQCKLNFGGAEIDEQNYQITLKRLADVNV